jgi:5-(hydroxymethyl)furfural/furfural oxidase
MVPAMRGTNRTNLSAIVRPDRRRAQVRLAKGFREIAALHELPPLTAVTSDAFPASFTDKIRKVSTYNIKKPYPHQDRCTLMDGRSFLRRAIIRGFIMESAGLVHALEDDEALETYIRRATVGVWHCSCSCRMGADDDPMAVTDHQGACAWRARAARRRRVDLSRRSPRQYQFPDHDGG